MTRELNITVNRHRTQKDLRLRRGLERHMLFLACALIPMGATTIPTLDADSLEARPVGDWAAPSLTQPTELGWNGASPAFGIMIQAKEEQTISLTVAVTDAESGKPINQARLTLEFTEPGDPSKLKRPKKVAYSAKTNQQGSYKFPGIPKGTIRLIVTAERHQSFSKEFELETANQVIEVKLKKPQPLL